MRMLTQGLRNTIPKTSPTAALMVLWGLLLAVPWLAAGCETDGGETDREGIARRDDGWLRGDLHLHSPYSDGWDALPLVVGIGEYLEDPTFLEAHPEYRGNGLDFLAITDHNNVDAHADPAWSSDRLILLNGMEWTGVGHANVFQITSEIARDPDDDGITHADVQAAVDDTHAEGGLFSMNHPFLPSMEFAWDIRDHDAVEVWNSGFALMSPPYTLDDLAAWEAEHGPASPFFRRAAHAERANGSMQALVFYEAMLARGIHVAVIGGSDRHTGLPLGFPTTWIRADTADADGLLAGIRARHTFVSRTPAHAQVLVTVTRSDTLDSFEMGDAVPIPASGVEVSITVRVGRAPGGLVRLVGGSAVASDDALAAAELGTAWLERDVEGAVFEATLTRTVQPGDWVYPVVYEPLILPDATPDQERLVRDLARAAAQSGPESVADLAEIITPLLRDSDLIFDASLCDPTLWDPWLAQCMEVDDDGMATFYVPDPLDRALNVVPDATDITDWTMGAVGSAVLFVQE